MWDQPYTDPSTVVSVLCAKLGIPRPLELFLYCKSIKNRWRRRRWWGKRAANWFFFWPRKLINLWERMREKNWERSLSKKSPFLKNDLPIFLTGGGRQKAKMYSIVRPLITEICDIRTTQVLRFELTTALKFKYRSNPVSTLSMIWADLKQLIVNRGSIWSMTKNKPLWWGDSGHMTISNQSEWFIPA